MNSITVALRDYLYSRKDIAICPSHSYLMENKYSHREMDFLMALGKVLWFNSPVYRKLCPKPEINGMGLVVSRSSQKGLENAFALSINTSLSIITGKPRSKMLESIRSRTDRRRYYTGITLRLGSTINAGPMGESMFNLDLMDIFVDLLKESGSVLFFEDRSDISTNNLLYLRLRSFRVEDLDKAFIYHLCRMIEYVNTTTEFFL